MKQADRIILGITGATGMLYLEPFLTFMHQAGIVVHAVISDAGRQVLSMELGCDSADLPNIERWFELDNFAAPVASGSSVYSAMVILPCTVGTMGSIAAGISGNLIHRAADVTLKEGRPLILAVRETPLNRNHLRNMLTLRDAGATIMPPMPSFYHHPVDLQEMAAQFAGRLCDQLGIAVPGLKRWGEQQPT